MGLETRRKDDEGVLGAAWAKRWALEIMIYYWKMDQEYMPGPFGSVRAL